MNNFIKMKNFASIVLFYVKDSYLRIFQSRILSKVHRVICKKKSYFDHLIG